MPFFLSRSPRVPDFLLNRRGSPIRRRLPPVRRYGMVVLFLLFSTIIGAYAYVTDSERVRTTAEQNLSALIGGKVRVRSATLSIFEGLRLEGVTVSANDPVDQVDSLLFSAQAFLVQVDLSRLVRGKLDAKSIIAIGPQVRLIEDVGTRSWNYNRLRQRTTTTGPTTRPSDLPRLPEIRLRNARVDYGQLAGGRYSPTGSMLIEAQLLPDEAASGYRFRVQSRGASDAMGPRITGSVDLKTRMVRASLANFQFDSDVRSMLPDQVQQFWRQHQLAGTIDIPQLSYPLGAGADDEFTAQLSLNGVTLVLTPDKIQGEQEAWRRRSLDSMFALLDMGGGNVGGWTGRAQWLIEPQTIALQDAKGEFFFTQRGVRLDNVVGRVEGNAFQINGRIEGYAPEAPLDLTITSLPDEPVQLPRQLRWINTLPHGAREPYDHLRPSGTADVRIHLRRLTRGAKVEAEGEILIRDGTFTFDKFPYPITRGTGRIAFGPDPDNPASDALRLIDLKGYGVRGGPNENSLVRVSGKIAPLSPDAGVDIVISGTNISNEPALKYSFPPMTRRALGSLNAPGREDWPRFTGDFECRVHRDVGPPGTPWITDVDIDIRNGEGALVAFPYHLTGVTGKLRVRQSHVEIDRATMQREDGAKVVIDGRVDWGREGLPVDTDEPTIRPKLRITAENAPIDENLLAALPETHRQWIQRLGLTGRFDLAGDVITVKRPDTGQTGPDFAFEVLLRDNTLWPKDGTFAIRHINGRLQLEPQRLLIHDLAGRRDDADVSLTGQVSWPDDRATVDLSARVTNLALDAALYQILPEAGRAGWDTAKPRGTVDAIIRFTGEIGEGRPDYRIVLSPRRLEVTPTVFPCTFTDVTGGVLITPTEVTFTDIIARRGEGRVNFSGAGKLAEGTWDFGLSASRVNVDPELVAAMPKALAELMTSAKLTGDYDLEFEQLKVRRPAGAASQPAGGPADEPPADVDFAVKLQTSNGALDAAVPVTEVVAAARFAGDSKSGKIGALTGRIDASSFKLGGKAVERLSTDISKPAGSPAIRLSDLRCSILGGEVAGTVDWIWPDVGSSSYAVSLIVRDADVRQLAADAAPQLQGRLTASLTMEGQWDNPSTRRGRGDLLVEGKEMYRIPVLLGLLQITNLSLPLNSPFTQGSVRYGVEGNRVTFESIELSADQMKMTGSGQLDFEQKRVWLNFVTDSTAWPKLPIIGDLLENARHELLQIRVRGSLSEPKVSAGSMTTITTTIDEVLRGGDSATDPPPRN